MDYKQVYDISEERLKEQWNRLADNEKGIFDYVINVLQNEAHIPESDYINTRDVLIPFITFLDKRDRQISRKEKVAFLRWIYAAMMWSRYSGSSDTRVEHDLSLLESESPTDVLMQEIRDDRGRIEVQSSDLEGRGKRTRRFYNMVRIVTRANSPVDWKTGEPLQGSYQLHSHHIFPKSKLYERYDSNKSSHRKLVNEIANRAFITRQSNQAFSDKLPEDYLPGVLDKHPDALESQYIPENEELWKMENYEDFLARRRNLLSDAINDYMEDLEIGTQEDPKETVEDLIRKGENARIEFKETFLYDVHRDQPNKELKTEVAKEICALANAEGGVVIIGIDDRTKEVKGLERDFNVMNDGRDDFGLQLKQEISNRLGQLMSTAYCTVDFNELDGKDVCVIYVDESPNPVYFSNETEDRFYVRNGTASEPLSIPEANEYIQRHFS